MIRMMKHYHTPLHDASIKAHKVSFSSYPGMLESLDDFYMMSDTELFMTQVYDHPPPTTHHAHRYHDTRAHESISTSTPPKHNYVPHSNIPLDYKRHIQRVSLRVGHPAVIACLVSR